MTLHFSICSKCSLRTLSSCVWRRRLILSLILFSYLLTATRFLVLRADNIYLSLIGPDRTSNLASKQTSGVTGTLFNGEKTRLYKGNICFGTENNVCSNSALLNPRNTTRRSSRRWGVCTTINRIGDAIKAILQIPDWKVVVVADQKTPEYPIHRDMVFLSVAEQMALRNQFKDFIDLIPWNHFGRKNIGYLYAIINGAEMIFDFDDDNILKQKFIMNPSMPKEFHRINIASSCDQTTNAYKFMGAPKSNVDAWPRGFPLNLIRNECREELLKSSMSMMDDKIAIYQSLADHEPDVDAIFRLTRTVPFNFDPLNDKSIEFPEGIYTPFNAQATFFLPSAFWSMLLPITVHGRVSDIWRSYIAQTILWKLNRTVAMIPPVVTQYRNAHEYLADFDAELDLYQKSHSMISILSAYLSNTSEVSIPKLYERLMIELFEREFIEEMDIRLSQEWMKALCQLN